MASYHLKPGVKGGKSKRGRQPSPQMAKLKAAQRAQYTPKQLLELEKCECDEIFDQTLNVSTPEEKFRAKYQRRANKPDGGYNLDYRCPEHGLIRSANGKCLICDAADAVAQPHGSCPLHPRRPQSSPRRRRKPPPRRKTAHVVTLPAKMIPPVHLHSDNFPQRTLHSKSTNGQ